MDVSLLHASPIILTSQGFIVGLYIYLGNFLPHVLLSWLFFALNYIRLMLGSVCQPYERLHWDLDWNGNEFID